MEIERSSVNRRKALWSRPERIEDAEKDRLVNWTLNIMFEEDIGSLEV